MFPPKSLRSVNKSVRSLPPDPAVDPPAPPAPEPPPSGDTALTCPKCGTSLTLKAVAQPSAMPEPMQAPPGEPDGGMF